MFVELDSPQLQLLIELVEARLGELGPELRRSRAASKFHDELKQQSQTLDVLLRRLHEAEYDVSC